MAMTAGLFKLVFVEVVKSPSCSEGAAVLAAVKNATRREGAVAYGHP
jgi:hypothetical protein